MKPYVSENGDVFIPIEIEDIHPKRLKSMWRFIGHGDPIPKTGTVAMNISSYIRFVKRVERGDYDE